MEVLLKALAVWVLMFIISMMVGALRARLFEPMFGHKVAVSLNGAVMIGVVSFCAYAFVGSFALTSLFGFVMLGLGWAVLTSIFEVFTARQFMDQSWTEVREMFALNRADLNGVFLLTNLAAPPLAAVARGLV